MSRHVTRLPDGGVIIWGHDRPFGTWYAQLYGPADDPPHGAPARVIGYHPSEVAIGKAERPDMDVGPYPVDSRVRLFGLVATRWGFRLATNHGEGT